MATSNAALYGRTQSFPQSPIFKHRRATSCLTLRSDVKLERLSLGSGCTAHRQNFADLIGESDSDWQTIAEIAGVIVYFRKAQDVCQHQLNRRKFAARAQYGYKQRVRRFRADIGVDAGRISRSPQISIFVGELDRRAAKAWIITIAEELRFPMG